MNTKHLIEDVRKNAITYGSLPFWSWNDRLEDEELRRQIRVMHDLGMNGFFMHARGGLETEYLSDDWFHAVDTCIDEAKKYNMEAWSYDENGWPSGFAGSKLLTDPKNHATYLRHTVSKEFPTEEHILGVYILEGTTLTRVSAPVPGDVEYHAVVKHRDPSMIDALDLSITQKFLAATHDEYKRRVAKEDFGTAMPGFFTDEPQYYRNATVWSETMPTEFYNAYGYNVFDQLLALFLDFDGAKEFRYNYWKLCHKLFMAHWIKPVYDWCEENGCRLTGHGVEESCLRGQMWCCGGMMPFYEYEHIPGMDYLGRDLSDDVAQKQLGSASEQLGKKKVMSEMFACCGWDVTPIELKMIAELQYAGGVNMMCQHLYAYSIRGQRKRDYPANYSEHLPWQSQMKAFNNYFNNLGYLLSRGNEYVNTLVIHPIHGAYLDYKREQDYYSIPEVENSFHALSDKLSGNQIPYHWGDETMLAKMGRVEGNVMHLGLCSYKYVIVPAYDTMDESTVSMLKEFMANGGKVWCFGEKPTRIEGRVADMSWLVNTTSFEEIASAADVWVTDARKQDSLRQMVRLTEEGRLIYLVNLTKEDQRDVKIHLRGAKCAAEIDLDTLEVKPVRGKLEGDTFVIDADFETAQAHLYVESDEVAPICPCTPKREIKRIPLDKPFTFAEAPENQLTIDHYALSYDGGKSFTEQRPLERVRDNLLREQYEGNLVLKAVFSVDELPSDLRLAVEPLDGASYAVNGTPITADGPWWLDRSFRTVDILPYVKEGENEITVSFRYWQSEYVYYVLYGGVSETLRNCLVFDTEIECMYLLGHFALKTPGAFHDDVKNSCVYDDTRFSIVRQTAKEIDISNIVTEGYPFFAGTVKVNTVYTYEKGGAAELYVRGRYEICAVSVNGVPVDTLMFTDHCDLSAYLREGDNVITLALTNSNRNLLGPHHGKDPEPFGVGPSTFSMENHWDGDKCEVYVDRYAFVRFGIDKA